jgi:hypothetical protein
LYNPVYYYKDNILRGTIIITGKTLASFNFFGAQKATVHIDIALNEGRVTSLVLFGIYKLSEKYFESKNYDGRKIIDPCVTL